VYLSQLLSASLEVNEKFASRRYFHTSEHTPSKFDLGVDVRHYLQT
jgi:hypothetical protein